MKIEIYDRKTKEVVEVIDVTEADEAQVLSGLHQQMDLRAYGTRVVGVMNDGLLYSGD
jgi:ABC-type phosphate/phosphonate transport system ATPase subunit